MFLRFVLLVTATIEVTMNNLGWKQKKEELVAMPGLGTQEASCLCRCSFCFQCNKCTIAVPVIVVLVSLLFLH